MIAATLHLCAGHFFTRSRCLGREFKAGKLSSRTDDAGLALLLLSAAALAAVALVVTVSQARRT
jgi:hypothetical protein